MAWSLVISPAAQDFPLPFTGDIVAATDADARAIYLYDTQTEITRRLSFGDATHRVWDFSPDGCRLLFTLTAGNQPTRLYSAALDGSDQRDLLDTSDLPAAAWTAWEPDWSPSRPLIALTLARPTETGVESRVASIPAAGGPPTFYSVAGDEHTPRWSPDGAWLAYISYEPRPAGATLYATAEPDAAEDAPTLREADVWMVSADGRTKERITRFDVGSAARPQWSPDGDLLGFVYSPSPNAHQFWFIAAAPDAIPTQLSYEWVQVLDYVWQPDGTGFTAAVRGLQDRDAARLWRVPLGGNADVDATGVLQTEPLADYPRYSPDGTWLAFRSNYALVLTALETGEMTRLGHYGNTPPVWSPSGFAGEDAC